MRRFLPLIGALVVVAIVVLGLTQAGGESEPEGPRFVLSEALEKLRGAPAPLAALHRQPSALVEANLEDRIKELEGYPVVVNKWASWCGPCRIEFPVFQRISTAMGKEVAFLGLNSGNNREEAAAFLKDFPLPFPSLVDESGKTAREAGYGNYFPTTAFYDKAGKRIFVHQGQYTSDAALRADVEKYAR
jgi:thiol-disulfide isomerase/thioredoxin